MSAKNWLMIAAFSAFMAVAIGAFAAHALKTMLSVGELQWVATASQYQMYHALGLLAVAVIMLNVGASKWLQLSAAGFCAGMLLFCGSLYALALSGPHWLVYMTPVGGLGFLLGWACLLLGAKKIDLAPSEKL